MQQTSKNDASAFKAKGGAADILNAVNMEVTQDALLSNVNDELQETAKEEATRVRAEWEASQKKAQVDDDDFDDDDFLNDKELLDMQAKRLADMQKKHMLENQFHAAGHGEYREIVEEEFLKEVCGSQWVVVHFYSPEFFRCKIVDKHLRIIAKQKNALACKFLTINAEKAPFFTSKLAIQMLPTIVVFKDGIVEETLAGFDELGAKDEFRTEVLEHWFSKAGCLKMKQAAIQKAIADSDDEDANSGSDDED